MLASLRRRLRLKPLEPWQRQQYIVVATVALTQISQDLTQPFIPLYVRYLGVTDLAEAARWSGLVVGVAPLCAAVMSPIWGSMGDRYGRRAMILRALTAISLLQMAQGLVSDVHWLLILRGLLGALAGFSAAAMALAVSLGPRERMGHAIGMVQAAQLLPTAIGPAIGGVLSDHFGLRTNFFVTGTMLLLPIGVMFFLVKEGDYGGPAEQTSARSARGLAAWRSQLALPGFVAALGIVFVARFADRSLPPILPLFLIELNTPAAQLATITGLVVSGGAVAAATSATLYGRRSRPDNTRRLLMIALGGGSLLSLLLSLSNHWLQVLLLRFLLGVLAGGTLSLGYTLGARRAPRERSGMTIGMMVSCAQLGGASAPLLGGMLGAVGLHVVFLANSIAYFVALTFAALSARPFRRKIQPEPAPESEAG
jgi:DHA1 family multidrug resistance protein-like MFS transporter